MSADRRTFLKQAVHGVAKASVAAGSIGLLHWLLRTREETYPPARRNRAEGSAGVERQVGAIEEMESGVLETTARRKKVRRGVVRPPGAVEERRFLGGCIRCTRCQDACTPGAIRYFGLAAGEHAHTPYIDAAVRACTLCMDCTTVCPSGVLEPREATPEGRERVRMATIELNTDLCLSYKAKRVRDEQFLLMELGREATETEAPHERRGPCGECYMFCPLRGLAIELEPGAFLAPRIHPDACAGCGMCEEICRVMTKGEPAIRIVPTREMG